MPAKRDLHERFWEKVNKNAKLGCWEWTGGQRQGYGRFVMMRGKRGFPYAAHRVSYEMCIGPIPEGLTLDHLCRNTLCVNPSHLEPVTNGENVLRGFGGSGINKRKSYCLRGHALTEDNIYRPPRRPHTRQCRKCAAIRSAQRETNMKQRQVHRHQRPWKSVAKPGYVAPADRESCIHGHMLTEENTYRPPQRPHTRQCRECRKRRSLESKIRRAQAVGGP